MCFGHELVKENFRVIPCLIPSLEINKREFSFSGEPQQGLEILEEAFNEAHN